MEEYQFFNRSRLIELQDMEQKLFEELVEKGEVSATAFNIKLVVLPPDLHEEKTQLLQEGFPLFNRLHYRYYNTRTILYNFL